MGESGRRELWGSVLALSALVAAVLSWLWPIGLGGRMPVGGDVTQFSIGLMAELGRSLRAWRLPLWNDLWGVGFPGVGESQMGVFYPPHWVFYGLFSLEAGYTLSLVAHTIWGALGAYWATRRIGVSRAGAVLAGISWSASGFFVIHLSHQWAYTTGAWMPWAWGLAWTILRAERMGRAPCWLAVVLALQLLPGHFQLAFCTHVAILVLVTEQAMERWWEGAAVVRRAGAVVAAQVSAFLLAGVQILPTLRLAVLAATRRDFEYLSGFSVAPLHLATFVAPALFEWSPLWRLVVWDPFHTSPEEVLGYIGMAPLLLALGAVGAELRRVAAVRALLALVVVCLWLALGPYVPGFRLLILLPGFSFFRAPARWLLPLSLALCLLAGIGFDALPQWKSARRALLRFAAFAVGVIVLAIALVELGLAGRGRSDGPLLGRVYTAMFDRLPWGDAGSYALAYGKALDPATDNRVGEWLARAGIKLASAPRPVFAEQRWAIYLHELAIPALLLLGLVGLAGLARRTRWLQGGLLLLTLADLLFAGSLRRVDTGPIASLVRQSPVLGRLAAQPRGTRTLEALRNLPMVSGAAPVSAYRTLNLPALEELNYLAFRLPANRDTQSKVDEAATLTGAGVRIYGPDELPSALRTGLPWTGEATGEMVSDPALAGWLFGVDHVAQLGQRAARFRVSMLRRGGVRAWFVPLTPERRAAILEPWSGEPESVLDALREAAPAELNRADPEHVRVVVSAPGPGLLVVSQLADPAWRGVLAGGDGDRPATLLRAFGRPGQGAWQAVAIPAAGRWVLRLSYPATDVWTGLAVTAAAAVVLGVVAVRSGRPTPLLEAGERT